jgi:hypothetical protein
MIETTTVAPAVAKAKPASLSLDGFRHAPFTTVLQDLERLLSQCRLSFLLGAGCSACAGLPMMRELTDRVQKNLSEPSASIVNGIIANFAGAQSCTIEDYMSELVDHLAISERRALRAATVPGVQLGKDAYAKDQLLGALNDVKRGIADCICKPSAGPTIETHRRFVQTIHGALRSGKTSSSLMPVEYFTLNYDTLLEDSLAIERVHFADGFVGGATSWWDLDEYRTGDVRAKVYKLHGSIDWCQCDGDAMPRRIRESVPVPHQRGLLIWPAATKYREAQRDPYAQLVSLMRQALRPQNNSEVVLCICGYSFSDEHINAEIDRALRESRERLTVLAFTSDDKPTGQLKSWAVDESISERIAVYANRGYFHGKDQRLSEADLPWWRFEVLTQLLAGER